MKEKTVKTVAKINNTEIVVIENGEKRVAIKPICQALGVNYSTQLEKIKNDEILGSVIGLRGTTGSDKKNYEMQTIPFKYVFGWLFSINPKNVAPEAKDMIIKYKIACYDALYDYFTVYYDFVEYRSRSVEEKVEKVEKIRENFNQAKKMLDEAKKELSEVRKYTFDDYHQMELFR